MPTWFDVVRGLGVVVLVTAGAGIAIWVIAREFRDMLRQVSVIEATANVRLWADEHGYTILFQEQVGDGSLFDRGRVRIVHRVVVQDQQAERKWASILSGSRFEVKWITPESWFALSSVDSASPAVGKR
jgi:hypothetical protein